MTNSLQIFPLAPTPSPHTVQQEARRLIRESVGHWNYFSEMDYYKSRFDAGGLTWQPIIPATAFGSRHQRKDGRNQYTHWSEEHLLVQRDAARKLDATDPIAQGVLGQILNFTVCEGLTYKAVVRKELPESLKEDARLKELAERCTRRIDDFWERYERGTGYRQTRQEFEREYFRSSIIDGERFLRFFRRPDGLEVRQVDPEYIRQPAGRTPRDGWSMGVHYVPGDIVSRRGYWVTREANHLDGEYVPADRLLHYTRNVPANVARGVSDFFSIVDDLDDVGRLVDGIRAGAKQKAKIAFIRSHKEADNDTLSSFATAAASYFRRNPVTGEDERVSYTPEGAIIDAGDNMDFKTMPQGATLEYIAAAKFCIYVLACARWNLPEFMITADTGSYNYSSIMVAGGPAVRRFKTEQGELCGRFRQLARRVLEYDGLLGHGDIPGDVLRYIDVQVEAPDPVIQNRLQEVQADQIEIQTGILSVPTAQQRRGLNPQEEDRNRAEWQEKNPGPDPLPQLEYT